ncbi:hypothetical protein BO79DRAFT_23356 [Aspergillus costaricaensis CBS 115574]|uniref:Uncharacterized protein n=1 Tax=Aspergillus costaricaensis CBS 115574 TaxID=1448317 RepID=A0ACD1IRT5_9EURO|nr:hypothetical protein BO79DRAFT_23356 [Aspergillus costaricaensis CBS 115574]RAK93347.1 hypothetical protein BO79DRAFT_23356 [Aspergillus costaricaensis CBS 115574]
MADVAVLRQNHYPRGLLAWGPFSFIAWPAQVKALQSLSGLCYRLGVGKKICPLQVAFDRHGLCFRINSDVFRGACGMTAPASGGAGSSLTQ